ncbi:50S ribosomal protein L23 [Candidatus Peregrinibacteria bacterium]|nr:50S ribosomal protein L23 [Candidatus Peregrinibacteria bacterium]
MKDFHTIIEPITTEKSTMLSDKGKYVFRVRTDATKVDVKQAIKSLYGVDTDKVTMTYIQPKHRLARGRHPYQKRKRGKKATVSIKDGKTIDITKFKDFKKSKK